MIEYVRIKLTPAGAKRPVSLWAKKTTTKRPRKFLVAHRPPCGTPVGHGNKPPQT